jgi:hypothetical protein
VNTPWAAFWSIVVGLAAGVGFVVLVSRIARRLS